MYGIYISQVSAIAIKPRLFMFVNCAYYSIFLYMRGYILEKLAADIGQDKFHYRNFSIYAAFVSAILKSIFIHACGSVEEKYVLLRKFPHSLNLF